MRTSVKTITVGSVLAVSLLATPAAFAATSDATATVTGGAVTVTATNVDLGAVAASHTAEALSGTVEVGVDDATGTGAGWSVTQMVGDFAYTGTNGGTAIDAANFSVATVGDAVMAEGVVAGGLVDAAATVTTGGPGALDTERTVLSAAVGDGEGSYTAPVNVELTVPAGTRAGTYQATLTTTAAPALAG